MLDVLACRFDTALAFRRPRWHCADIQEILSRVMVEGGGSPRANESQNLLFSQSRAESFL